MLSWLKLEHAHNVATSQGFKPIEVPWVVPHTVARITRPLPDPLTWTTVGQFSDAEIESPLNGAMIGSGEQGFLAIWDQLSPDTKYVTTTPCFRHESSYTPGVTEPWFMKTELIWVGPSDVDLAVTVLMNTARRIMGAWVRKFDEVKTEDGWDLHVAGMEVGSYGVRMHQGKLWAYGTGLAEPRFTTALKSVSTKVVVGKPRVQQEMRQ